MGDVWGFLWLILLLGANAFFVSAEFALVSARRSQIEPLAEAGSWRAARALYAMENVSLMLACAQLGITICSLLMLNVVEPSLKHLVLQLVQPWGIPAAWAEPGIFLLVLLAVTFLHVTFGEMVPKNISVSAAEKMTLLLAPLLVRVAHVCRPVIVLLNNLANWGVRIFHVEPKGEVAASFTLAEVRSIVAESVRRGLVEDETGLITGALGFSSHTVEKLMVPVDALELVPCGASAEMVEEALRRTGFSRFLFSDDRGQLVGYIHVKDLLSVPAEHFRDPLSTAHVRPLLDLDETEDVENALRSMQATGIHLARVVSVKGQTRGALFLEDVLEELVGEIHEREHA